MAGAINDETCIKNASMLSCNNVDAASSKDYDESLMKFITPFTMSIIGNYTFI